ncbi:GNAT superfamily N-acetyltransferase [Nocardia transvalensis]|uniref:GNAT superfamily N-acetyltransferase n=1 Tax=Nocardia transvalensis TaxID=37333 RepID=A0A7W9PDQ3_9NOCA|nr:GNAT family N-acetyltransferase [Nocardia transvalensis]MBB5914229.1 GNAT superfamily N-acetyltransferase [Nocardia transvalensis]
MTTEFPDIPPGRRVMVRYRLPDDYSHRFTDVIGELVTVDPPTVRTADGQTVSIAADRVVAVKALGPRPIRTGEIRALEAAACDGWPGVDRTRIDGWLLSAGHGYTNRANSAVPLGVSGEPALAQADTLYRIGAWYTDRGLPLQLRLPDRLAPVPPGWRTWSETVVMGIDIGNVVLPQGPSMVRIDARPTESWLELYRFRGEDTVPVPPPAPAEDVLTAVHDGEIGFAALGVPTPLAVGRGAVTTAPDGRRWIGLSCVAVAAPHRRHGLGTLICAELLRWGHRRGATHAYVQVEADNGSALAMYRELGFVEHHSYRYAAPA